MKIASSVAFVSLSLIPVCVCAQVPAKGSFLDTALPLDRRVADLVSRMSPEERISQLMHDSPGIERLGVPSYDWWNEALHGVARAGRATVFPQPIGLAATFDEALLYRIATATSDEARAKNNAARSLNSRLRYTGLTFWSPNINIFRDPRWGRGMETYGEDPFLSGLLGTAFVRGLQGNDPKHLKTAACAKHFAVHSGPEGERHSFDAHPPRKDLWETYLPAFERLVREGQVEGVMCAYNRLFGSPCCGSDFLLGDILRGRWGFQGYIVSDCWALEDFHDNHKVTPSPMESAAMALKAGVNLDCGETFKHLSDALGLGLVSQRQIDEALGQLLRVRFRLGEFDPPESVSFSRIAPEVIRSEPHVKLAREAAAKSVVLLKNNGVLPLDSESPDILVVGPNAASVEVLLGNYHGLSENLVTILEGIVARAHPGARINYKHGFPLIPFDEVDPDGVVGLVRGSPVTIVVLGSSPLLEGEEGEALLSRNHGDRRNLALPGRQLEYLRAMREGNPNQIIAVVMGGGPIDLGEVEGLVDAMLFAWYPGEQGGHAVADILFGDVNPSGRLPVTFPASNSRLPPFEDYSMAGRTYRFATEEPHYPFGYGKSYTEFTYRGIGLNRMSFSEKDTVRLNFLVENSGEVEGEEIAQIYLHCRDAAFPVPVEDLKAVQRVRLKPGETRRINVELFPEDLLMYNERGQRVFVEGEYRLTVGGCSPGPAAARLGMPEALTITFRRE